MAGLLLSGQQMSAKESHFLYIAVPGIRNYVQYGGVGILVFDMDNSFRFVKRMSTWDVLPGEQPENVKGVAASARTGKIYVSTQKRLAAFDAITGTKAWDKAYEGGCDRMAISPDGRILYVPAFEGPFWDVANATTGDIIAKLETNSRSHNTVFSADGSRVYLAGLASPFLSIADPGDNRIIGRVGPFSAAIRPFTVNGRQTLCFVNVDGLLGFEMGDLRTGKMLYRVQVHGYEKGPVKRHGCPSHGIGLTPDERELWVSDGANNRIHVFNATVMPPKQIASVKLRDMPGWVTFSVDGRYAFPSTGDVIDTQTKRIAATLHDEHGQDVQSEKMLELVFSNGKLVRAGNQFGVGAKH